MINIGNKKIKLSSDNNVSSPVLYQYYCHDYYVMKIYCHFTEGKIKSLKMWITCLRLHSKEETDLEKSRSKCLQI